MSSMSAPIYVLRHGETVWNTQHRQQGHRNSPLTARGQEQARRMGMALGACLGEEGADLVSSTQGRAVQTAGIVIGQLGERCLTWTRDARLREIGIGDWEGHTREELLAAGQQAGASRDESDWFLDAPGAEPLEAFAGRIRSFLDGVRLERPLVVVCHGQTSMVLRGIYLGMTPEESLRLDQPQDVFYRLADGKATHIPAQVIEPAF